MRSRIGAVNVQRERAAKEREWWKELKQLANADNVAGFYRRYADYLEWNNVISPSRQAIHKMAKRAAEMLEK